MAERTRLQNALDSEADAESTAKRLNEIRDRGLEMLDHPDPRHANAFLRKRIRVTIRHSKIVQCEIV